jgi:hypothetical protein
VEKKRREEKFDQPDSTMLVAKIACNSTKNKFPAKS